VEIIFHFTDFLQFGFPILESVLTYSNKVADYATGL
tara:strand:- start:35548 stop:35655 length:108 start_codon:yes stop_codon:yes gene_type:complete